MGWRRSVLAIVSTAVIAVAPFVISSAAGATVHSDEQSATISFRNFNGVGQVCTVTVAASVDDETDVLTTTATSDCTVRFVFTLTYKDDSNRLHTVRARQDQQVDLEVDNVFAMVRAEAQGTFSACTAGPPGQVCSATATAAPK